jgi:hypothetical protein
MYSELFARCNNRVEVLMERFKLANFSKDYPGATFPDFEELVEPEAGRIVRTLSGLLELDPSVEVRAVAERLYAIAEPISGVDATESGFVSINGSHIHARTRRACSFGVVGSIEHSGSLRRFQLQLAPKAAWGLAAWQG